MNTSSKVACAVVALVSMVSAGSALKLAHAQAPVMQPKPTAAVAQGLNCAGETSFRMEVDRPHDLQVSMSRPAGASGWNTMLMATGRVATLDRSRTCGAPLRLQVTAEEPDARAALQTCAIMGASMAAGQKWVFILRLTEGARAGAGGALMLSKPAQIDCGVE